MIEYIRDYNIFWQNKTMLRCSGQDSWKDAKHKDVAYFHTAKGWWSPKFGNLNDLNADKPR